MPPPKNETNHVVDHETAKDRTFVTVSIPPAVECMHPPTWHVGGANRVHPCQRDVAAPSAITEPTPHWGFGTLSAAAQPMRVSFHERAGTFAEYSRKAGRTVSGRGPHEQANFEEMEVDPIWIDLNLEGAVMRWSAGNTYTPDFVGLHADVGVVVGEVKADSSYFVDRDYAPTVANAERTCAAVGITFMRVIGTEMHARVVRRQNVRRAFIDRFTQIPVGGESAVADLLAAHGTVALGRLEEVVAPGRGDARSVVNALLCTRSLSFDLNLPVNADTIVGPAPVQYHSADIRALEVSEAA